MSDLDEKEQNHVRTALRYLRRRAGSWKPVADALHVGSAAIAKLASHRAITASVAFRVARLAGVSVDDLISGRYLPGACPRCGYVPDFGDEPTRVEDGLEPVPGAGLKVVK